MKTKFPVAGVVALAAGLLAAPAQAGVAVPEPGGLVAGGGAGQATPGPAIEGNRGHPAAEPAGGRDTKDAKDVGAIRGLRGREGPPTVTAEDIRFTPKRTLEYGSAREADLVSEYMAQIEGDIAQFLQPSPEHPMYAGAVAIAGRNGTVVTHGATGYALRYASYENGTATELPPDERIPMRRDTIFDLASLTKVFTAMAVMQQVEAGRIDLDTPVAHYIPEFAQHGKGDILVRQLLTHTSGLPAWKPLYEIEGSRGDRIAAVFAAKPEHEPGEAYVYSDLGYITLGELVSEVTGKPLDEVIAAGITEPLGMHDTMYTPPERLRDRIAATEFQPWVNRGLVWGRVHDENAWSLGGVAGHAGLFSSAHDLAIFAQTLLNGGVYDGTRILGEKTVRDILTNHNTGFSGNEHGLGFELGQHWYMDAMATPVSFGHTGYTGTSLVADPVTGSFAILLTNRVHPTREWGSNNPSRRALARDVGRAVPVKPAKGKKAWFSGMGDERTATLTLPLDSLDVPDEGASLAFDLWYSTESTDIGALEASADGGRTWQPVPLDLRARGRHAWTNDGTFSGFSGRQWIGGQADIPAGTTHLRWRYTTDPLYQGRGVYIDGVRIRARDGGLIFNGHPPSDAKLFQPDGWHLSPN